ncbi:cytochrome P450 [Biscogniauxia mediterranea]|nr:cytochrome P450 [Biscogniauxia mediterranea]
MELLDISRFKDTSFTDFIALVIGTWFFYQIVRAIYNLFFHPLSKYPGPLIGRITSIPYSYHTIRGRQHYYAKSLFDKYGPVVRTSPNTLGFISAQAGKDIYTHRNSSGAILGKAWQYYRTPGLPSTLFNSDPKPHAVLRKSVSPAFSEKYMRVQEPVIGGYIDLLIRRLREAGKGGQRALNLRDWYTFTTFDVIGKLAFSSDFGCLEGSNYHPWVHMVNKALPNSTVLNELRRLTSSYLMTLLNLSGAAKNAQERLNITGAMLSKRIEAGSQPDFMDPLIQGKDTLNLDFDQLKSNADMFVIAGSETTATLLTGATYLLLTNPAVYEKVVEEVRSSFASDDEITLTSVNKLSYMLACLNETLRRYPPAASWLPRIINRGDAIIDGNVVPQGCVVSVYIYPSHMSESNFTDPEGFHPERFLGDPRFANDHLDAVRPFSIGPYDCIGRNLAYAEMRLILARVLFNFDLRLADDSKDWLKDQKVYGVWDKPDLHVYLTPVSR